MLVAASERDVLCAANAEEREEAVTVEKGWYCSEWDC